MKLYTGQFGIVLLMSRGINIVAERICREHKDGNVIRLGTAHIPHLTLYGAKFLDLPFDKVHDVLQSISRSLPMQLSFMKVMSYGGKFLFWNTHSVKELLPMHEEALSLAEYFDNDGEQQADAEGLKLSEPERLNVTKYGHPLVNDLWMPHITVGYFPEGVQEVLDIKTQISYATSVAFVRLGNFGTISEVVYQQQR